MAVQTGPPVVRSMLLVVQDVANGTPAQVFRLATAGAQTSHALAGAQVQQVTNTGNTAAALSRTLTGGHKYTLCTLEPGERYDVPPGVGLTLGLFTAEFPAARKGWPAGNALVVVRSYLDNGKEFKVTTEKLVESTDFVANSNGVHFMNRGLNAVTVNEVVLQPGQELILRPEPGYLLSTPLRVTFDDGTTGRNLLYSFAAEVLV